VVGVRENALYGYGLVVGLAGSGDTERILFTQQSLAGMLGRLGIRIDPKEVRARNVAAVMVTAKLPPFARPGTRIDIAVASMGNARSLAGGVLLVTPLTGGDGKVYAVGQGPVQVAGYAYGYSGTGERKNTPTSGRVSGGATVERAVELDLTAGPITVALRRPDLTTASRLAAAVNQKLGPGPAKATDPAGITITLPEAQKADPVGFLASIEVIEVEPDLRPKVVVSERTGTVVAGEGVKIRAVVVSHGGLQVKVQSTPVFSQPNAFAKGDSMRGNYAELSANEGQGPAVALPATSSVEDLAKALTSIGASPRDLIAVLEAMKSAGALDAELEVLE
jgi:flagellar P-ring protein precursor FlgI